MYDDGIMNFDNAFLMKYIIALSTSIPRAMLIRAMVIGFLLLAIGIILYAQG